MVVALGGPTDFSRARDALLPRAPVSSSMRRPRRGLRRGDRRARGRPRGGRTRRRPGARRRRDRPAVGLTELAPVGAEVGAERPLACVHARDARSAEAAVEAPSRRLSTRRSAALAPVEPVVERILRGGTDVLFAFPDWDAAPWRARLQELLPAHEVVDARRAVRPRRDPLRSLLAPSAGRARKTCPT